MRRSGTNHENKMQTANPRAVPGDNSQRFGGAAINETALGHVLRQLAAAYNHAVSHRRDAAERLRDIERDERAKHADYFRGLEDARLGAMDRKKAKLRERADYQQAEADKADASARQREATKQAKVEGIDAAALKMALKLQAMDPIERRDHFDAIDIYAKQLGLWSSEGLDNV